MKLRWSIIICTHNRAGDLQEILPRLANINYPLNDYEILVVDNASSDTTQEVIRSTEKTITNLKYIREEKLGLSYARNRGIENSTGEFIAFIDDDAWPEANWLEGLEEYFNNPRVACVGGMVKPFWLRLNGWPKWLHERHIGFFTVVEYSDHRVLHYPNYPAGANIAFRRKTIRELGSFNPSLGRNGESLLSGEETELCLRIEQAGYNIIYTPKAVVHHKVHENRLTKEWVKQRSYWQGITIAVIENKLFNKSRVISRSALYLVFIFAGMLGKQFYSLIRNEKMAFFCSCQLELCRAYISAAQLSHSSES